MNCFQHTIFEGAPLIGNEILVEEMRVALAGNPTRDPWTVLKLQPVRTTGSELKCYFSALSIALFGSAAYGSILKARFLWWIRSLEIRDQAIRMWCEARWTSAEMHEDLEGFFLANFLRIATGMLESIDLGLAQIWAFCDLWVDVVIVTSDAIKLGGRRVLPTGGEVVEGMDCTHHLLSYWQSLGFAEVQRQIPDLLQILISHRDPHFEAVPQHRVIEAGWGCITTNREWVDVEKTRFRGFLLPWLTQIFFDIKRAEQQGQAPQRKEDVAVVPASTWKPDKNAFLTGGNFSVGKFPQRDANRFDSRKSEGKSKPLSVNLRQRTAEWRGGPHRQPKWNPQVVRPLAPGMNLRGPSSKFPNLERETQWDGQEILREWRQASQEKMTSEMGFSQTPQRRTSFGERHFVQMAKRQAATASRVNGIMKRGDQKPHQEHQESEHLQMISELKQMVSTLQQEIRSLRHEGEKEWSGALLRKPSEKEEMVAWNTLIHGIHQRKEVCEAEKRGGALEHKDEERKRSHLASGMLQPQPPREVERWQFQGGAHFHRGSHKGTWQGNQNAVRGHVGNSSATWNESRTKRTPSRGVGGLPPAGEQGLHQNQPFGTYEGGNRERKQELQGGLPHGSKNRTPWWKKRPKWMRQGSSENKGKWSPLCGMGCVGITEKKLEVDMKCSACHDLIRRGADCGVCKPHNIILCGKCLCSQAVKDDMMRKQKEPKEPSPFARGNARTPWWRKKPEWRGDRNSTTKKKWFPKCDPYCAGIRKEKGIWDRKCHACEALILKETEYGECAVHKVALCAKCLFREEERPVAKQALEGGDQEKRYICRYCNKVCGNGGGLASHEKTHSKGNNPAVVILDDDAADNSNVSGKTFPSSQTQLSHSSAGPSASLHSSSSSSSSTSPDASVPSASSNQDSSSSDLSTASFSSSSAASSTTIIIITGDSVSSSSLSLSSSLSSPSSSSSSSVGSPSSSSSSSSSPSSSSPSPALSPSSPSSSSYSSPSSSSSSPSLSSSLSSPSSPSVSSSASSASAPIAPPGPFPPSPTNPGVSPLSIPPIGVNISSPFSPLSPFSPNNNSE